MMTAMAVGVNDRMTTSVTWASVRYCITLDSDTVARMVRTAIRRSFT